MKHYIQVQSDSVILTVYVKPNATKTRIVGVTEQGLNIALKAKPIEGEANQALIRFISKYFKVPQAQCQLISGTKSRLKRVKIPLNNTILANLP